MATAFPGFRCDACNIDGLSSDEFTRHCVEVHNMTEMEASGVREVLDEDN